MSLTPKVQDNDRKQAVTLREVMERFLSSLKSRLIALDSRTPDRWLTALAVETGQRIYTHGQEVHEKMLGVTNHEGKAHQIHLDCLLFKKKKSQNGIHEDVKKLEPCVLLLGV